MYKLELIEEKSMFLIHWKNKRKYRFIIIFMGDKKHLITDVSLMAFSPIASASLIYIYFIGDLNSPVLLYFLTILYTLLSPIPIDFAPASTHLLHIFEDCRLIEFCTNSKLHFFTASQSFPTDVIFHRGHNWRTSKSRIIGHNFSTMRVSYKLLLIFYQHRK